MKAIIEKMLECLLVFLPFLSKTEQEESGEDERVQRAGEGTVWLPRRATGEGVAGLLRAECTREGDAHRNLLAESGAGESVDLPLHAGELRQAAGGGRHCGCVKISPLQAGRLQGRNFFVLMGQWLFLHRSMLCVPDEKKYICPYLYK